MSTAYVHARLFTATGTEVIEDGAVVVDGDRIAWVGAADELQHDGETVDLSGRTVLPGLCDAHAHLVYSGVTDVASIDFTKSIEQATVDAVNNARLLLELGFTSARDVGTRANIAVTIRNAVQAGALPGPRIKASKQIISTWGGLGDWYPTHIFRREQRDDMLTEIVTGPWEARNAVRQQIKDGVDWVKVEASGTGFNPLCPAERDTMSAEELNALVDEARARNRPVCCHAESRDSIIKAARAGVATVEHAIYLDDEGLEALLANDVAVCPTLGLYTAYAERGLEFGIPPEVVENHNRTHEHHVAAIRKAYDAGVTIIAGSDSGLANFPQGGGREEICSYVSQIGMSPAEALLTATRNATRVVGFGDELGTLEAGKLADLLVLREDPTQDIRVIADDAAREAVLQGGRIVAGVLPSAVEVAA
jgi:imidazolonepropionase-like amidohydrolase